MPAKTQNKPQLSNNVYVSADARVVLEDLILEVGYKRGRVMSASAFVRYMIENFGEQAKIKILKDG